MTSEAEGRRRLCNSGCEFATDVQVLLATAVTIPLRSPAEGPRRGSDYLYGPTTDSHTVAELCFVHASHHGHTHAVLRHRTARPPLHLRDDHVVVANELVPASEEIGERRRISLEVL